MRNEFTAVIERDGDWFIAYCPEILGANGQGRTIEECRESLADAIALVLEARREAATRKYAALRQAVELAGYFVTQVVADPDGDHLVCASKRAEGDIYTGRIAFVESTVVGFLSNQPNSNRDQEFGSCLSGELAQISYQEYEQAHGRAELLD